MDDELITTDIVALENEGIQVFPQTHAEAVLDLDKYTGAATLSFKVGKVDSTEGNPEVINSGTETDVILDFELPRGETGEKGDTALTVSIGQVKTVSYDEPATVSNVGTDKDLILNFNIPKGEQGEAGEDGSSIPLASNQTDGLMSSMDKAYLEELKKTTIYFEKVGEV